MIVSSLCAMISFKNAYIQKIDLKESTLDESMDELWFNFTQQTTPPRRRRRWQRGRPRKLRCVLIRRVVSRTARNRSRRWRPDRHDLRRYR